MRVSYTAFIFAWLTVNVTMTSAQTRLSTASSITSLDVISVKPNHSGGSPGNIHALPDGIRMDNIPLSLLLRLAYGLSYNRQIIRAPEWVKEESFDIEARVAESDLKGFNGLPDDKRVQNMLQIILADRFKLVTHRETQSMSGYALVIAKRGTNLQPRNSDADPESHPYLSTSAGKISMHGLTMASLASALTRQIGKAVQDRSGLVGNFDVELRWTDEMGESPSGAETQESGVATDAPEPGIFTALQEQLGLRLESAKVPVECLIVDHIERPEAN
jgi:uncharacterized protein (TIGR03435 family)